MTSALDQVPDDWESFSGTEFAPVDAKSVEELAQLASEVATSVARHRQELAAAMQELTTLQRTLRSDMRSLVAELDRVAAGIAPDLGTDNEPVLGTATEAGSPSAESPKKKPILSLFRRAS